MGAPPVIRYDSYLSYVSTAHVTVTGRILRLVIWRKAAGLELTTLLPRLCLTIAGRCTWIHNPVTMLAKPKPKQGPGPNIRLGCFWLVPGQLKLFKFAEIAPVLVVVVVVVVAVVAAAASAAGAESSGL
ncbi:uncharacterized protein BDR25DRAFT_320685 [Lindgomyces ingoldianus]|uniref:Uncharacterized protein n=1 Tax=Lindgomyces ingoldianus TaxID=673940 RepID=A0ACB6Q6L4_9PLEO|nr:uncharacterized protein BDR25DRAFT_320685 [Lindgomyces ingoldianus]KAF2462491.1 hypothetical protein BDR25DRAFT_320685 [Lindgomyces ingoldianus]